MFTRMKDKMHPLLKIILCLLIFFSLTFFLAKTTGLLSLQQIEIWFEQAQNLPFFYIGALVTVLLCADIFITVPTLSITILAGYFLGFFWGVVFSLLGMILAGGVGYFLSRKYGHKVLNMILKEEGKKQQLIKSFGQYGFRMILFSRGAPMLPEITACLSGVTKMPPARFFTAWMISSVPYSIIATYSGTISTIDDPAPAIFTAVLITCGMWFGWYKFARGQKSD